MKVAHDFLGMLGSLIVCIKNEKIIQLGEKTNFVEVIMPTQQSFLKYKTL